MWKRIDLTGQRFGRLTVTGPWEKRVRGNYWKCLCDCGSIKWICIKTLRKGAKALNRQAKSCGCLHREWLQKTKTSHGHAKASLTEYVKTKHGHARRKTDPSVEYRTWIGMKNRCYCKSSGGYEQYGMMGIRVCDHWINSFENFLQDMGPRPPGTSLDRIDPWGPYAPNNCRWATNQEQNLNKRRHYNRIRRYQFHFLGNLVRVGDNLSFSL